MRRKIYISSVVFLIYVVWLFVFWLQDISVWNFYSLIPFGVVLFIIMSAVDIFDRYIWSWKILKGWYVKRPDIRGTWEVELESSWIDPKTNKKIPPIYGYVAIRQTLTFLSVRLMTQASKSELVAHSIEEQEYRDLFKLVGVYRNEPKIEQRSVSEIHYGSFVLDIHGSPVCEMQGHYWTDRGTKGGMKLSNRVKDIYSTYEEAERKIGNQGCSKTIENKSS